MAKKNTWFEDVFLPSLYQRYKANGTGELWLTRKQVACFSGHMAHEQSGNDTGLGTISHVVSHSCTWEGRKVTLVIERNGAGRVSFGFNPEEQRKASRKEAQRRIDWIAHLCERTYVKHPELYQQELKSVRDTIESCTYDIADGIADQNTLDVLDEAKAKFSILENFGK